MTLVQRTHFNLTHRNYLFCIIFDLVKMYFSGAIQQNMFWSESHGWQLITEPPATCDDRS